MTHHALAEVIGVNPRQRAHEQGEHVCTALWVMVGWGDQAASHADHAAESGGEGVRLRQGLHRCVHPFKHKIPGGKFKYVMTEQFKGVTEGQCMVVS